MNDLTIQRKLYLQWFAKQLLKMNEDVIYMSYRQLAFKIGNISFPAVRDNLNMLIEYGFIKTKQRGTYQQIYFLETEKLREFVNTEI